MNSSLRTASIVVPLFNERASIVDLWSQTVAAIDEKVRSWEVIVVDDGSTDGSDCVLEGLVAQNLECVTAIRLRGNFGKAAAMGAGNARATGDVLITMDADLRDNPGEIARFLQAIDSGFDAVCGYKRERRDPWRRVAASRGTGSMEDGDGGAAS